ncbi:MAG: non-homologous end-joining DNA ligase, partial [Pseudobdellovibrio sp.]
MSLREYRKKRDFSKTKEPVSGKKSKKVPIFVVQEHWATHHHFDFRLEAFGTLKSWAVPKGPSIEVGDKRLAVEVEDHPIDYAHFHGTIPEGEYGAGEVEIWDKGSWVPPEKLKENLSKGHLEFELNGKKLKGKWLLQRTGKIKGRKSQWLLIKRHDDKTAAAEALPKKVKRDSWPTGIQPQLATLTSRVPPGAEWIHEIKLDGYRTLTYLKGPSVQLKTRNGLDWSKKYSLLAQEFKKLKIESAIFDGEVVVMNAQGHSDFSALQKALKEGNTEALQYYLFDLLYLNGQDLRDQPLETRKQLLKALLQKAHSPKLIFSTHWRGQGEELFKQACRMNLEGIVSKSFKKPYRERRTDEWLKTKCALRQELVIGGYTEPSGSRAGFGALLMGLYENGKFKYVGRVGTGFNDETLSLLYKKLKKIEIKKNPFVLDSPGGSRHVHWV